MVCRCSEPLELSVLMNKTIPHFLSQQLYLHTLLQGHENYLHNSFPLKFACRRVSSPQLPPGIFQSTQLAHLPTESRELAIFRLKRRLLVLMSSRLKTAVHQSEASWQVLSIAFNSQIYELFPYHWIGLLDLVRNILSGFHEALTNSCNTVQNVKRLPWRALPPSYPRNHYCPRRHPKIAWQKETPDAQVHVYTHTHPPTTWLACTLPAWLTISMITQHPQVHSWKTPRRLLQPGCHLQEHKCTVKVGNGRPPADHPGKEQSTKELWRLP